MQTSSRKINKTIERQMYRMLYQVFSDASHEMETRELFESLLSEAEKIAVAKRLAIAVYLDKGRSYEDIKNHLKVSSATIAAVAEQIGDPGVQRALRYIKADEWASEKASLINDLFKKLTGGQSAIK
jgi:Trp operon repressor